MSEQKFSGTEVFEMTWAVLESIDAMRRQIVGHAVISPSLIADSVRMLLNDGSSPVGLRVEPTPSPNGGYGLHWISFPKHPKGPTA